MLMVVGIAINQVNQETYEEGKPEKIRDETFLWYYIILVNGHRENLSL